jgi:hypothetical protein
MCGVDADKKRQYTFAEVNVTWKTTSPFQMSFFLQDDSDFADESCLVDLMGGTPVSQGMVCWNSMIDEVVAKPAITIRCCSVDIDPESDAAKVSGCQKVVQVTVPIGPCLACICWSANVIKDSLFIPTQNENMSSWRVDAILMQGYTEEHGRQPTAPLRINVRENIAASAGVMFAPMTTASLIRRWGTSLPFHNLWIPLTKRESNHRLITAICGARIVDDTKFRVVSVYDVLFSPIPIVCGCFIRNVESFKTATVPLVILERITRTKPARFADNPDGSATIILYINDLQYIIDPSACRTRFMGIDWLEMKRYK